MCHQVEPPPEEPREFLAALEPRGLLAGVSQRLRRRADIDLVRIARDDPQRASMLLCQVLGEDELQPMEAKYVAYCLGQLGFQHAIPLLRDTASNHAASGVRAAATAALNAVVRAAVEQGADQLTRRAIIDQIYPLH